MVTQKGQEGESEEKSGGGGGERLSKAKRKQGKVTHDNYGRMAISCRAVGIAAKRTVSCLKGRPKPLAMRVPTLASTFIRNKIHKTTDCIHLSRDRRLENH